MHQPSMSLSNDPCRARISIAALSLAFVVAMGCSAKASADEYLPALGGGGGGRFEAHCPPGKVLTGFDLRAGDDVDAIRPQCAAASGPREVGASSAEGTWYGGHGGRPASVSCNRYSPVLNGLYVAFEGKDTVVVNNIHLYCGEATNTEAPSDAATAMFDAPGIPAGGLFTSFATADKQAQRCRPGQVAVGLHGRSGSWVDAIGLICGDSGVAVATARDPAITVTSIGRLDSGRPAAPTKPICDAARDARARKSPAADRLEAQCKATLAQSPNVIAAPSPDPVPATQDATRLNPQPLPPKAVQQVPATRTPGRFPPPKQPVALPAD